MSTNHDQLSRLRAVYENIPIPPDLSASISETIRQNKNTGKRSGKATVWGRRLGGGAAAAVLALVLATNISASACDALEQIPVIGSFTKVVTFRNYTDQQKNTAGNIEVPHITGLGDPAIEDSLNANFNQYAAKLIAQYESDVAGMVGSGGHESVDSTYKVLVDNKTQLTVAIYTVIARGDAQQINTYYNIDKQTGQLLTLKNLFRENADYIKVISANIKTQMEQQMANDSSKMYFISAGGINDGFTQIAADQPFYLDAAGNLVVSFNEADVAPAYMGAVTFTIPPSTLAGILAPGGPLTGQ